MQKRRAKHQERNGLKVLRNLTGMSQIEFSQTVAINRSKIARLELMSNELCLKYITDEEFNRLTSILEDHDTAEFLLKGGDPTTLRK